MEVYEVESDAEHTDTRRETVCPDLDAALTAVGVYHEPDRDAARERYYREVADGDALLLETRRYGGWRTDGIERAVEGIVAYQPVDDPPDTWDRDE